VVEEIAWLKSRFRPDHLWIADDIFGLKPGWIERFAALAQARDAIVPFKCLLRADGVNDRTAAALRASGCRTAWIGAESGSQRILDAMEKGIRVEQIAEAARILRSHDMEVGFFLQFGYPGETIADIDLTRSMVRACAPDDIGISVSYPLPGTPFFERVKAQLGAKRNWVDSDDLAMMYRATYVPEFYRVLHALVHAEFRRDRAVRSMLFGDRSAGKIDASLSTALRAVLAAVRLPVLRRRVRRLARQAVPGASPSLVPVLSQRAAAIPTEQTP
jgi:anaerobic magnesium-protoporphyrin IX monomethyl ester cyclase